MPAQPSVPPPPWPEGSVAQLSDPLRWERGAARDLAGRIADVLPNQMGDSGPLPGADGTGQRWLTSGMKATRAGANAAFERARCDLALTGPAAPPGLQQALGELLRCADDRGTIDTSGGYMAYAPTAGLFEGALAAFGCATLNPGLTWMPTSPSFAAMERCVIDWVAADVVRWPAGSGGVFTSGGSVANTLGLHTAREAASRRAGVRAADVVFFLPAHAHYCFAKALRVLGVDPARIVQVPSGADARVDLGALANVLDAAAGQALPLAGVVIAVGGETSTGAVDPLAELAALCAKHSSLWLHVDGCFGGFFAMTERGAALLAGIEQADSVALDPHKALQAPYGNGLLMVRREDDLRRAFAMSAAYVPPSAAGDDHGTADLADLGLELTRDARAAQVWLPLRAYGPRAFAQHLDWCQDAVTWLAETLVGPTTDLAVVTPPQLSTVTLRLTSTHPTVTPQELAAWLADDVNARGRVMIAPTTTAGGVPCVRVCILSARTRPGHLAHLAEDLLAAAAEISRHAARLALARLNPERGLGFRVPYAVRPLPGKGLSIIAAADIAAGSVVWEFEAGACPAVTVEGIRRLAADQGRAAAQDVLNHCFCWDGEILYPQGDTQFFNHASRPNIATSDRRRWLALRAIAAGEELLDDYGTYDSIEDYERLCVEFGVDSAARVTALFSS